MKDRDGKIIAQKIDKTNSDTLFPIINDALVEGSTVIKDGHPVYTLLQNDTNKFHHETVEHRNDIYVRGIYHTNRIEGFWSLLKLGIIGIYHQVSKSI